MRGGLRYVIGRLNYRICPGCGSVLSGNGSLNRSLLEVDP